MLFEENLNILKVYASEYLERAESGRSHPMKCICEPPSGTPIEVYVKYKGFHNDLTFDYLTAELVANQLALDLNLPASHTMFG